MTEPDPATPPHRAEAPPETAGSAAADIAAADIAAAPGAPDGIAAPGIPDGAASPGVLAGAAAPGVSHEPAAPAARSVTLMEIVSLFGRIGLTSFGGGLSAWLYREVVGRRQWIPEEDFLGALTMAQILPGANIINLAIYVGHRLRGALGATLAVLALLGPPMIVVILVTNAIQALPAGGWLHDFLEGVAASAIGLTAAMGLRTTRRAWVNGPWTLLLTIAIFAAVGVMQWPLIPVVLVLGVVGWLAARAKVKEEVTGA
ncbi:MAG TPA: chromate transporter [Burkholderiales bacterium]|jgi:chromate transporter